MTGRRDPGSVTWRLWVLGMSLWLQFPALGPCEGHPAKLRTKDLEIMSRASLLVLRPCHTHAHTHIRVV